MYGLYIIEFKNQYSYFHITHHGLRCTHSSTASNRARPAVLVVDSHHDQNNYVRTALALSTYGCGPLCSKITEACISLENESQRILQKRISETVHEH